MAQTLNTLVNVAILGGVGFLAYEAYQTYEDCKKNYGDSDGSCGVGCITKCFAGGAVEVTKDVAGNVGGDSNPLTNSQSVTDSKSGCFLQKAADKR